MMAGLVAVPLLASLVSVVVGTVLASRLRPEWAARVLALMLASSVSAAVITLWLLGLSGLAHLGVENPLSDWSAHLLPGHSPAGAVLGPASLLVAIVGTARGARVVGLHRRLRCRGTPPLQIIESEDVFAHTLPGPAGTVVVSTALRGLLPPIEFDTVIAHERAHARHRHDRLLVVGLLAEAFVPPVSPVVSHLEYQIERWADEEAARTTGRAREDVGRTLAKVALGAAGPAGGLGIARHSVVARAEALLRPAPRPLLVSKAAASVMTGATLLLTMWQLRDMAAFVAGLHP
jgi:Zn-dependent protease with chaperone function